MPALSGPRSLMPTSMVSTWAPSLDCKDGFFRNNPTIPHMALRPFKARKIDGARCRQKPKIMPAPSLRKDRETFLTVGKRPANRLVSAAGVADDRQVAGRQLAQLLGTMGYVGIEIEAIARL